MWWLWADSDLALCRRDEVREESKGKWKLSNEEGVKRMMYGRLNALMTFPSTYKDLMEDALLHMKWKERGELFWNRKTEAKWKKKGVKKERHLTGASALSGE